MLSGKSFFNKTLYKKTLLRCWPLWLTYIALWTVVLPLNLIDALEHGWYMQAQRQVLEIASAGGAFIAFVACAAAAMAVFGWMYNTRHVSFTASLPVSRSAHYLTAVAAGLTMLLGSNVVVFLLTALVESAYGGLDMAALWQWLGWTCLLDIHFFGFAACCAMLTGHLLILPAVYTIFQVAAAAIQVTLYYIFEQIVWGFDYGRMSLQYLSPIVPLASIYPGGIDDPITGERIRYVLEGWPLVLVYAGVGIVLIGLGWWLFQKRRMETATDVVAVPILKPVFRWCLAFAGSLGFGGLLSAAVLAGCYGGGDMAEALLIAATMVFGGLVGWCLADVLMGKSIRAFMRHWKGAVLYAALMALFIVGAELDVTGYEKRLPDTADVGYVYVSCSDGWADLEEPENIAQAMALHKSLIQNRTIHEQEKPENGRYINVTFSYSAPADETGHSKTLMNRHYTVLITDELAADPRSDVMQLQEVMNSLEAIRERKALSLPVTAKTIYHAAITPYEVYDEEPYQLELTAEEAYELYTECILPDIAEGTLGRIWIITDEEYRDTVYNVQISMGVQQPRPDWAVTGIVAAEYATAEAAYDKEFPYQYDHFSTVPTVNSRRTNAWLESHGVPLETIREAYERTE